MTVIRAEVFPLNASSELIRSCLSFLPGTQPESKALVSLLAFHGQKGYL